MTCAWGTSFRNWSCHCVCFLSDQSNTWVDLLFMAEPGWGSRGFVSRGSVARDFRFQSRNAWFRQDWGNNPKYMWTFCLQLFGNHWRRREFCLKGQKIQDISFPKRFVVWNRQTMRFRPIFFLSFCKKNPPELTQPCSFLTEVWICPQNVGSVHGSLCLSLSRPCHVSV